MKFATFIITICLLIVAISCGAIEKSLPSAKSKSCKQWQIELGYQESALIQLPHESDCRIFYECQNGMFFAKQCPKNLHFNPYLKVCDYLDTPCITFAQYDSYPNHQQFRRT